MAETDKQPEAEAEALPYHHFFENDHQVRLEGRFWNQDGKQVAIVACVTKGIDWAAYIGTDAPDSWTEQATLECVAKYGCKLGEKDALHFFPAIKLPYRG